MEDTPFWAEAYHGHTWIHPAALVLLGIAVVLLFIVPRMYTLWPVIFIGCFVAPAQRIVVFGMDWTLLRLTLLAGLLRALVLIVQLRRAPRWHRIDTWLVLWLSSGVLIYCVREPSMDSLNNRLGWAFEYAAAYFLVRTAVVTWKDVRSLFCCFAFMSLPVAIAFINEQLTRYNVFGLMGGVELITREREGRLRCQGAFAHPILAGTYWAVVLPLIAALFWQHSVRFKFMAAIGIASTLTIVAACASSGPVASVLAAVIAGLLLTVRAHFRYIRMGTVAVLTLLHLVMEAPVWHLVARIDIVGGSTGWHRFNLIDQWIRNTDNWFLVGTTSTATWAAIPVFDITNQYVLEAIRGGALTLFLFLGFLWCTFSTLGRTARRLERTDHRLQAGLCWALGVSMFVHAVSWLAVSYFGQILVLTVMVPALAANVAQQAECTDSSSRTRAAGPVRSTRHTLATSQQQHGASSSQ
ncbi:MAG: hypothetical protein ACF8R9_05180 [Phycisphaerales bacterium JB054]